MDEEQARIEAIGDQLRAKIGSKFQTSTFLAGFALTVLSIQISILWGNESTPLLLPLSIGAMVVAIGLYIFAAIKLDELTMPKPFWPTGPRPEDQQRDSRLLTFSDLWDLQGRMVFYWQRMTVVATYLSAASLLLMLVVPLERTSRDGLLMQTLVATILGLLALSVYVALLIHKVCTQFNPLVRPVD